MKGTQRHRQILIIGLDGMPYRLIDTMSTRGVMPHLRDLIATGVFRQMSASIPEVSSVSWSTIITGKNPGVHGIYGFTDVMRGGYGICFPNYASLGVPPFWERHDRPAVILNVPSTYPARAMNGAHVSGFVAPKLEKAVFPPSLMPQLKELDYRIDVDSLKGHQSTELFLKDVNSTLDARGRLAQRLWDDIPWDTFMLVFTGTDRLGHFLWDAYEEPDHPYHDAFLDHLRRVDRVIGMFIDRLDEEAGVLLLSDHGFERLRTDVNVNAVLKKNGYLRLANGQQRLNGLTDDSRAFALDPGRIYVHLSGRYPRGSVSPAERDALVNDLAALFEGLRVDGRPVVRRVCRKEEIYSGPLVDRAPDLVLVADEGFNLKASLKTDDIAGTGPFTGKHSQPDAFLVVRGAPEGAVPEEPDVTDVAGIIDCMVQQGG